MTAGPVDAARDALIALQGQLIAMVAAQNAALAERVGELAEQPGRTPPAGKPQRGRRGKRNPGKQPGAPGSYLAWSQDPDRTVPHFPPGTCACGADLAGAVDLVVAASHQEIEIPEMAAQVIQHDLHAVACSCGRVHRAAAPPEPGRPAP